MSAKASLSDKKLAAALVRREKIKRQEAFDPQFPDSKPTAKQQEVFDDFGVIRQQWIRAGNQSGKSQTCARIVMQVLKEEHPTVKARRANPDPKVGWGEEPLLAIVAGRTGKQIEESLLPKLRSYLEPGTYKEVRIGNIIQRLEIDNGNRIVFQSLENPTVAQERLMSYVAHITWVDELPPTMELVREVLVRTQARNGYSLWSFTPTRVAAEIQKFVDSLTLPAAKVYRFHMLDNPLYSDPVRRQELIDRYSHLPKDQQDAVFNGDWLSGDLNVYYFNYNTMTATPDKYSRLWRHVEVVDPALSSALGLTIWAEEPTTNLWYCVLAKYIKGIYVPTAVVAAVKNITKDYNIVKRISDPHEVWYIQQAAADKIFYEGVYKKNDRKDQLIKGYQQALGSRIKLVPGLADDLIDETQECRWSDKVEGKIVNASSYHLLDTAQYFCDSIPKVENKIIASSHQEWLYKANNLRLQKEELKRRKLERISIRRRR
jgi:hypothetical protein